MFAELTKSAFEFMRLHKRGWIVRALCLLP